MGVRGHGRRCFLHLSIRGSSHTFFGSNSNPPGSHPAALLFPIMPLAKGAKAPDFTLKTKTADGLVDVRLSDNFGKKHTVLLFFPAAFSSVCTQEMCDQTSGLGEYES